jgi:transposase
VFLLTKWYSLFESPPVLAGMEALEERPNDHQYPVGSAEEAKWRSAMGLSRELKMRRSSNAPHPKVGGSSGYPLSFRRDVLRMVDKIGTKGTAAKFGVSIRSIQRWVRRVEPYRATGNKQREVLTDLDQFLLTLCLNIYPRASADDIASFIVANGGDGHSRQTIYKRMKELGFNRKIASIEAFAAYTPENMLKAEIFWTHPPRAGVMGVPRYRLIDVDETHFNLKATSSRYGYALGPVRVRDRGHYQRGESSINVILAIEPGDGNLPDHVYGSIQNPRKWFRITTSTVDEQEFADFINEICEDIEESPASPDTDRERIFLWDNLSAHKTPLVRTTLEHRGQDRSTFYSIARPPYQPKWAPIEYIFCQIATELRKRVRQRWTKDNLMEAVHDIIMTLGWGGTFDRTFRHCGYYRNY